MAQERKKPHAKILVCRRNRTGCTTFGDPAIGAGSGYALPSRVAVSRRTKFVVRNPKERSGRHRERGKRQESLYERRLLRVSRSRGSRRRTSLRPAHRTAATFPSILL